MVGLMQQNSPELPAAPDPASMRAVERITLILRSFSMAKPMLTLTEVARETGLDKNTTRRLLMALVTSGLVRRNEADGTWGLDIGVLKLQPAVLGPRTLRETASPFLQGLTEQTRMTSFFWIADPEGAICIERVRASGVFLDVPWSTTGTVVPLNMAAGPRVILAHVSDQERATWLSRPQLRHTRLTETDPADLLRAVARIRLQGYELVADDFCVGMAGLGVPVLDRSGKFVGAISVTSSTGAFQGPGREEMILSAARATAAAIGIRLGFQPGKPAGEAG